MSMSMSQVAVNLGEVRLPPPPIDDDLDQVELSCSSLCSPVHESPFSLRRFAAGILLSSLSAVCFTVTTVIAKCQGHVPPSQIALFRYTGIMIMSFPLVVESGVPWFGPNSWWFRLWIGLRAVLGATSLFCKFASLLYIPLTNSTIIGMSSPVFVFVFARVFLREPFGLYHAISLCLSLVGIGFATKQSAAKVGAMTASNTTETVFASVLTNSTTLATSITDSQFHLTTASALNQSNRSLMLGTVFALTSTLMGSLVFIIIRKLKDVHHSVILFNFSWLAILEMLVLNYVFYDFRLPTNGWAPYMLFTVGVLSFYAQMAFTKAVQIEEAGVVAVIRASAEAICAFVGDIVVFGVVPDLWAVMGAMLVLVSVILLALHKYVVNLSLDHPCRTRFYYLAY